ncbi:MAG: hypothetical protein O7J95_10830, partial [Planctomycetota bacterium]|nr:hypothetical protein [Planctomycetota bacterium]
MSLRTFALLTFSLLPLAGRGFAQEPFSATNLELAVSLFGISANRLLFSVSEFSQGGADLNGDGDSVDRVLHVHDLETGTTTNLEVEQAAGSGRVYGKWLVFLVDESRPGGADLNRDGDSEDHVFHVHDLETGTTTNLEVAIVCDFFVSGNWLVFPVSERERGGADLNRDGDSEDSVVHVHDLETGTATNLELAIAPVGDPLQCFISALPVSGNWLVFMVSERGQGGADLNRDGDSEDSVLHVHDLETGTTTNLELASNRFDWRVYGKWLLFAVRESVQGGVDLNRDGDSEDLVLHLHDLETGTTTNLELATTGRHERVFGKWLVFVVWERTQGGV